MNKIIERFRDKAIERSGIFLFAGPDAVDVVNEARRENLTVLGIDGFFIFEDKIQPSLENSVDFSTGDKKRRFAHSAAVDFIGRHANLDLYFEIVFGLD